MPGFKQMIIEAIELFNSGGAKSKHDATRIIGKKYNYNPETLRKSYNRYEDKAKISENHEGLASHCQERGIDVNDVTLYWDKTKEYSVAVRLDKAQKTYEDLREEIVSSMNEHSPNYNKIVYEENVDCHLLVIDPADIHIGKLATAFETGEDYNSNIAVQRVHEGVDGILNKVKGFNIDQILLIIGNDILHIDTPKRTTTSGTPQDTDGMWYENFLLAKQLYVEVIE
jgi:hypothetical protein